MQQISDRYVRAFQRLMGIRGGDSPRADPGILSVVVLDDHSRGGYSGALWWHVSLLSTTVVAQNGWLMIANNDPITARSVVVVDRLYYQGVAAGDLFVRVGTTSIAFAGSAIAPLADIGESQGAPTIQAISSVIVKGGAAAGNLGEQRVPTNDALPHVLEGPYTLAPQTAFVCSWSTVNTALMGYFQGRYYPPT